MNITVDIVPETQLTATQRTHLKVARQVARGVPTYPARMHNSAIIIGGYKLSSGPIYIAPQRLHKLSTTMNTTIHELAHHVSQSGDNTRAHNEAIKKLSAEIAEKAKKGEYDKYLNGAVW